MNAIRTGLCGWAITLLTGCGTPGWEAGYSDDRDYGTGEEPASLFELEFGSGEPEVTKNVPGDAAKSVGQSIKSWRQKSGAEANGE